MAIPAVIKIVMRRGALADWLAANPVLLNGEIGYVTDAFSFVIGDGVKPFDLLYDVDPVTTSNNRFVSEAHIQQVMINAAFNTLTTAIANEATLRSNADAALQLQINNEVIARTNADTGLQTNINNEETARITADGNLQTNIDTVQTNLGNLEANILNWYGTAINNGDILVFDASTNTFVVFPVGDNEQFLIVDNTQPLGLNWKTVGSSGDMTKAVYDSDNDGVVDSAERTQIIVRNSTGVTLQKGQIVYLSGATGNRPNAVLADASDESTSSKTIGIVYEDIINNTDGYVVINGTLHNLNTSAYNAGDTLWLSETAGAMQANTPPAEPAHAVFIGYVARKHPTEGRIVLAIQNGYELNELHGVLINSVADKHILYYQQSSGLWVNASISTVLGYTPADESQLANYELKISLGTTSQYWRGDKTWQTLNKSAVGLSNVDNTSDANKPISTATQTALNGKEPAITSGTVADYWRGDKSWQTLNKTAVGLSNVDNTSDANKPISTATQTALNGKEPTITAGTVTDYWRGDKTWQPLNKAAVGLGNVDNTSDADKPVSTAVQTSLNTKQDVLNLTTTGTSGPASLVGNTLNIPQYSAGGGISANESIAYAIALG